VTESILITGITGFVGSHLADLALEKNCKVYGLKRWNLSRLRNIRHIMDKIEWIDCDITDPVSVKKAITKSKPDKIFHLAAESFVSPSWDHPTHYMDVNYKGTVNIFEAVRELNLKSKILIPGSGEEYGEISEDELPITEKTLLHPVNPYAVTKIAQDLISYVYHKSYNLNVIRVRAFNHEGPRRDNVFGIPWYAYQIARIESGLQEPIIKTGHIDDRRNFTHVRDMVEAYWIAIDACPPGELHLIGSDNSQKIYSYREVIQMLLKRSTVKNIKVEQDPQYVRPTAVPRLIGDTSKFHNLTGWEPKISVDTILDDTLEYWRDFVKNNDY
jgi:GDP-4-dehydro-6-deoxy-D-mannose reductase